MHFSLVHFMIELCDNRVKFSLIVKVLGDALICFRGLFCLVWPLAALFALLITLQLLLKAKTKVVVNMTNNLKLNSCADIAGHLAAICGSALVTAAMAP